MRTNLFNFSCLIFGICWMHLSASLAQTNTSTEAWINELQLGMPLEPLKPSVYLITGKEQVYRDNPWLAQSYLRNLDRGIIEAIYEGQTANFLNGRKASDTKLHFFNEHLYKIRWTFERKYLGNPKTHLEDFKTYLIKKYGNPTEVILGDTFIWDQAGQRLQLFADNESLQVELRDDEIEKKLKAL